MKKVSVLIIEDDPAIRNVTQETLENDGFLVSCAPNLSAGRTQLQEAPPDLLVLDLQLPDGNGMDLCRELIGNPETRHIPVFIVTARGATENIVEGLEAGARDYIVKPFDMEEFLARVRAICRHQVPSSALKEKLVSGKLRLMTETHKAWCDNKEVNLTLREFDILKVLMRNVGVTLSRKEIIAQAWGPATFLSQHVVDVHTSHVRIKLGKEGKRIETVPQVGFKLASPKRP